MNARRGHCNQRPVARLFSQAGRAEDVAMAFGGTALVLAMLGTVMIYTGAVRSLPMRVDFGLLMLTCAAAALIYAALNRER
ncbi:MAG: hypothetical protein J7M38_13675, partial [Armatimonadetes bacterium]|nr:hypothetical protein [Armatimonadota bacterium]